MTKLDRCEISTAKSLEEIKENIYNNIVTYSAYFRQVHSRNFWRENTPIAIVGGGPSLAGQLSKLNEHFPYPVIACGSVHDYLISNHVYPNYCAICDPDEVMIEYLKLQHAAVKYLIASQCHPKLFEYFKGYDVSMWHAGGDTIEPNVFGDSSVIIGGGCTIGTRAIVLAIGMGYDNIHLYGFDTCLGKDFKHHAYDFAEKDPSTIGNIHEISLDGPEGKKFYVAGYMLGQLFDFQNLLSTYANRVKFTIHGDGLLKHLMDLAERKVQNDKEN